MWLGLLAKRRWLAMRTARYRGKETGASQHTTGTPMTLFLGDPGYRLRATFWSDSRPSLRLTHSNSQHYSANNLVGHDQPKILPNSLHCDSQRN